jgi:hypothetical protein
MGQSRCLPSAAACSEKVYTRDNLQGATHLLEIAMKNLTAAVVLLGILGFSVPSSAREGSVGRHTADEVKRACDQVGGKFSQDTTGYYCGTNCHGGPGTDCTVGCKTGQACIAQVIGARRATTLVNALQAPPGSPR